MREKKDQIVSEMGKELPGMTEKQRAYLMGWLEGFAANAGINQIADQRTSA